MTTTPLDQLARSLSELDLKFEYEDNRISLTFTGNVTPYYISIVARPILDERWWNLGIRAYTSFRGNHAGALPLWTIPPLRIDEAHRFINFVNARWMGGGHLFLDPEDGDLSFDWTVPAVDDVSPSFVDYTLRRIGELDHFFPEVRAILAEGLTAMDAIRHHLARDEAATKTEEKSNDHPDNADKDDDDVSPFEI